MPAEPQVHSHIRALAWMMALIAVIFIGWYIFRSFSKAPFISSQLQAQAGFPKDAPAPRQNDYTTAQKGFQYLVQYNTTGFHPASLSIKKGETIRFTNTSLNTVQILLGDLTSGPLTHMQYAENTFDTSGTFNVSSGDDYMTITVN